MTGRTEIRVREIRRRTRRYRRRRENRELFSLTAFGLFLLAGISVLLHGVQAPGVSAVAEGYGSVLLREDAGAYIVVGIAAFVVGVTLTVICIRLKKKKQTARRMREKVRSKHEKTNTQHPADLLHGADNAARNGPCRRKRADRRRRYRKRPV